MCSGRKSRSVNKYLPRPDFVDLGLLLGLEASRPTDWGSGGKGKLNFALECRICDLPLPGAAFVERDGLCLCADH